MTTERRTDGEVFAGLLEPIDEPIARIDADGVYDTREVYLVGADRVAPPRENAVPQAAAHPGAQALTAIAEPGSAAWKRAMVISPELGGKCQVSLPTIVWGSPGLPGL